MPLPDFGAAAQDLSATSSVSDSLPIFDAPPTFPESNEPCDNPTHLSPEIWHLLQGAMYGYRPKSLKRVSAQLLGMATAVVLTRWHFGK